MLNELLATVLQNLADLEGAWALLLGVPLLDESLIGCLLMYVCM
jgi:hypothetical protein